MDTRCPGFTPRSSSPFAIDVVTCHRWRHVICCAGFCAKSTEAIASSPRRASRIAVTARISASDAEPAAAGTDPVAEAAVPFRSDDPFAGAASVGMFAASGASNWALSQSRTRPGTS